MGHYDKLATDTWYKNKNNLRNAVISQNRSDKGIIEFTKKGPVLTKIDAAFPILHGKDGEFPILVASVKFNIIRGFFVDIKTETV